MVDGVEGRIMGWVSGGLAVVCLAVGLFHLFRLVVLRRDVAGDLAHAAMGLGMAAMFSPLGDPVPAPVWTVVFALGAAWFAVAVQRSRTLGGDAGHHLVGSGAMLFMLAAGHGAPAADSAPHAAHAAHGGGMAGTLGLASVAALVLTGYFAWHALRCAHRCRRPEPAATPPVGGSAVAVRAPAWSIHAPQTAAAAHLVMAVAMAVMLLGMV
jgi:Domain of unknown function (DUF5134)